MSILSRLGCILSILLLGLAGGFVPVAHAAERIACSDHVGGIEHDVPGHDGTHIDSAGGALGPAKAVLHRYAMASGEYVGIAAGAGRAAWTRAAAPAGIIPDDMTLVRAAKPATPPPRP